MKSELDDLQEAARGFIESFDNGPGYAEALIVNNVVSKATAANPIPFEVDVTKKYILQFDGRLSAMDSVRLETKIRDWLNGDFPFLFLDSGVKLVRVDRE